MNAIQLPAWIDLLFGDIGDKNKLISHATAAWALAHTLDVAILSAEIARACRGETQARRWMD